jgi:hypothetical protein
MLVALSLSGICRAGERMFGRSSVPEAMEWGKVLRLPAAADTSEQKDLRQDWSSDSIKDLLASETGEPQIEGTTWQKRKSPRTAMLCALVFPGLGQVYNEKALKAVIAMGVQTFYIMNILHNYRKADDYLKQRDSYDQWIPCGPADTLSCPNPDWRYNNSWYEEYKERTVDWIWWTAAVYLVVLLDAYVDAHLHDMRFRLESAGMRGGRGLAVVVDF